MERFYAKIFIAKRCLIVAGEKLMFCPFCHRQIKDNLTFCPYCKKALPQRIVQPIEQHVVQPVNTVNPTPESASLPKRRISWAAQKAIVTGIVIIVLVIVVLQFYYPSFLPWNW
jgi:hypothetical protein